MSSEDSPMNAVCDRARLLYGQPALARPAPQGTIIMPRSPQDDVLGCKAVD